MSVPHNRGMPRDVVLLGSTGSVGTQAIDVMTQNPDRFRVVGLGAGGQRPDLLAQQALELGVEVVAVAQATAAEDLQLAFYAAAQAKGYSTGDHPVPKILAGPDALTELAAWPCDVVLNGMTGSVGLAPTLAALEAGRTLALANKESLIAGGPLVLDRLGGDHDRLGPGGSQPPPPGPCPRGGPGAEGGPPRP